MITKKRFLYLQQERECECIWYVVTKSNRLGSTLKFGKSALSILSANKIYSSILFLLKIGASNTHKNECTEYSHKPETQSEIAWYFALPDVLSRTMTWKKVSTLYWEWLANKTGFKLR